MRLSGASIALLDLRSKPPNRRPNRWQGGFIFREDSQMHQPPTDIPASELFLKLLEPQPSVVVDFPRKGLDGKPISKIRIQVLSHEQHDFAREIAFKSLREKGYSKDELEHVSIREVVGDRIAKELIALSCHSDKSEINDAVTGEPIYGRVFRNGDEVGKLRATEVSVLFSAYMLVQDRFGPNETSADVDGWVKRLTEGGESFPLLSMDLPELVSLTSSLADRISTISRDLESQWTELPDTCKSLLEKYNLGTGFWSLPLDELEKNFTENYEPDIEDAVALSGKLRATDALNDALGVSE